jgi:hypothetical protein
MVATSDANLLNAVLESSDMGLRVMTDVTANAPTGDATLSTALAGVRKWSWYNSAASNRLGLYDWTNSLFRFMCNPDGNCGVGGVPSYAWDIQSSTDALQRQWARGTGNGAAYSMFKRSKTGNASEWWLGSGIIGVNDQTFTLWNIGTGSGGVSFSYATNAATFGGQIKPLTVAFSALGAVSVAGFTQYCTDCTTAATCAGSGTGHMAVSNGTAWTCQ